MHSNSIRPELPAIQLFHRYVTPAPGTASASGGQSANQKRSEALVMQGDSVLGNYRGQIAEMALQNRLPSASIQKELAEAGFLLTYGADIGDLYRRSAVFVERFSRVRNLPTCRSSNPPHSNL
jgi:hypothetical protein